MKIFILYVSIIATMLFTSSCMSGPATVKTDVMDWSNSEFKNSWLQGKLSNSTTNCLVKEDLSEKWQTDPAQTVAKMDRIFHERKSIEVLSAMTELNYVLAENSEGDKALEYYINCLIYSYELLFNKQINPNWTETSDPALFSAARYYNYSAAAILKYFTSRGIPIWSEIEINTVNGNVKFTQPLSQLYGDIDEYKEILSCFEHTPENVLLHNRGNGFGVPLITRKESSRETVIGNIHINKETIASTLFIHVKKENENSYSLKFAFYDVLKQSRISIDPTRSIPLEYDLTTPIVYKAEHDAKRSGWHYLLNGSDMDQIKGLYTLAPYDPDKIPLVFVHGLISSPETWLQAVNIIFSEEELRNHYQVFLFAYPTGNPILYSAYELRNSLYTLRRNYDRQLKNKNFTNAVIVGHSMGGLLSKIMVQNSGDDFLAKRLGGKKLEDFKLTPEQQQSIYRIFNFKRVPFITRAVFISTPHRGASMAEWSVVKWISANVDISSDLKDLAKSSMENLRLRTKDEVKVTTGLSNLDPDNATLKALAKMQIDPAVKYHTIIGDINGKASPDGTDSVVPYSSSHLQGAESEIIVKSGHSAQETPAAIKELVRILYEHLDNIKKTKAPQPDSDIPPSQIKTQSTAQSSNKQP